MEFYQNMAVVVVTPTASEQSLTERGYTNFFRANANDAIQAAVDAEFLAGTLGAKRVAVVHNDTEYGKGLAMSLYPRTGGQRRRNCPAHWRLRKVRPATPTKWPRSRRLRRTPLFYAGYEIEAPYLRAELVEAGD